MADFYAGSSLEFWIPEDQPFPANPAEVIIKNNFTPLIVRPNSKSVIDHPNAGAEIRHPSTEHRFIKTMIQSPVIHVTR